MDGTITVSNFFSGGHKVGFFVTQRFTGSRSGESSETDHGFNFVAPRSLTKLVAGLQCLHEKPDTRTPEIEDELGELVDNLGGYSSLSKDFRHSALPLAIREARSLLSYFSLKTDGLSDWSIKPVDGFVQFSLEDAIRKARIDGVDEGRFVSALLGINPDIIRPGLMFDYYAGSVEDHNSRRGYLEFVDKLHNDGNELTTHGIDEMFLAGREQMLGRYRVYYAGEIYLISGIDKEHLNYVTHQLGHDVWFSSLNNDQRSEFVKLVQQAIEKYFRRNKGTIVMDDDHRFERTSVDSLLKDREKFDLLSETFAVAFGRYTGFPIFHPGRTNHSYMLHWASDEIFEPFFQKYNFKKSDSCQPHAGQYVKNNSRLQQSAMRLALRVRELIYPDAVDSIKDPLQEHILAYILVNMSTNGGEKYLDAISETLSEPTKGPTFIRHHKKILPPLSHFRSNFKTVEL